MPSGKGTYGKKVGRPATKTRSMAKAMPTAEFNRKIAAVKSNPTLTPAQKQAKINQMKRTRVARKSAMIKKPKKTSMR